MLRPMRAQALIVLCCLVGAPVAALGADSATTAPGDASASTPTTQDYYNALLRKVTLQIAAGPDGAQPTVESAIAQICRQAGVPYQAEVSRTLVGDRLAVPVPPADLKDVVAADAIRALCAKAGLEPQLDAKGVYVAVKVDRPPARTGGRELTPLERAQLGAGLNVSVKTLLDSEVQKEDENDPNAPSWTGSTPSGKETRQSIKLEVSLISTKALKNVRVEAHVYATKHGYGGDTNPSRARKQTVTVGSLAPGQARTVKPPGVVLTYTEQTYHRLGGLRVTRRFGEKYYGWVIEVYTGNTLIKSVASSQGLLSHHKPN